MAIVSTESVLIFAATESPMLGLCSMGLLSPLITIVVVLWVGAEYIDVGKAHTLHRLRIQTQRKGSRPSLLWEMF